MVNRARRALCGPLSAALVLGRARWPPAVEPLLTFFVLEQAVRATDRPIAAVPARKLRAASS